MNTKQNKFYTVYKNSPQHLWTMANTDKSLYSMKEASYEHFASGD